MEKRRRPVTRFRLRRRTRVHVIPAVNPNSIGKLIGVALIIIVLVVAAAQSTYVVEPGFRGVQVTLGKVSDEFKPEGFGTKQPFISSIIPVPVRQLARELPAECY
jgi:prohibitin 2